MKKMKKHLFAIAFLVSIVTFAWHKILFQSFTGEGYYYIANGFKEGGHILRFDVGAELLFDFWQLIFKDNLAAFQYLVLVTLVALVILYYFMILEFTRSRSIAFLSALLFGVNYGTIFEMIALGAHQNFGQRVIFFVFLFPAFLFFCRFINKKEEKYFFTSVLLFFTGVFLAHFNVFFATLFLTYFFGLMIVNKYNLRYRINLFFHAALFLLISGTILYSALYLGIASYISHSFFSYVTSNTTLIGQQVLRQLAVITVPDVMMKEFMSIFSRSFNEMIPLLYIPILVLHIFVVTYLWFEEKKLRAQLIAIFLFVPIVFILNMYVRSENIIYLEQGSRYLFVPSMGFVVFWSMFFFSIAKRKILKYPVYVFIGLLIGMQILSIWREIDKDMYKYIAAKKSLAQIKKVSSSLQSDSIVIVPSILGPWGAAFCQKYYGKKDTLFIALASPQIAWEPSFKRTFNPKKDYIFAFDYTRNIVIDITKDYKKIIIDR